MEDFIFGDQVWGGYGAILHGRLNFARGVYSNIPQTVLLGSKFSEYGAKKYFENIFGNHYNAKYNDLRNLFDTRTSTKYYLCFNQLEGGNYFEEQGLKFIQHLNNKKNKMYVEIRPYEKHAKNHSISEAIGLFKKYD